MRNIFNKNYSVITFATNKFNYLQFAFNLARSILLRDDISIYIISNLNYPVPIELERNVFILPAKPEHAEMGIGMKLYMDEYLQTENSLFIDSDCICFGSLSKIFNDIKGQDVTVAGNMVNSNLWCTQDQADVIYKEFNLNHLIRFNGGLYYIKKSKTTQLIFDKARTIANNYDEYGFGRIKNKWINEEIPLSVAMMIYQQLPLNDNGTYMTDLFTDHRPYKLNVLKGKRLLKNPAVQHRYWYPALYSPIVLHFGGNNLFSYPYIAQIFLLKLNSIGFSVWISSALVSCFIHPLFRFYYFVKIFIK